VDEADADEPQPWIPEFAPWDGRRVPVTLLSGYLGAGKTTVLNALLHASDRPVAVLVNDVGAVNIDAALVRKRHADTVELTDGCICCSMTQGLADAFDGLRKRDVPPDQVVIELSGVADPRRVLPWTNSAGFVLDGTIVLIDAQQFEARVSDEVTGPTLEAQVDAADLAMLTKTDVATPAATEATVELLRARRADLAIAEPGGPEGAAAFVRAGGRRPGGVADVPATTLFDPHETATWPLPDPIDEEGLGRLLDQLPSTTVRAKGVARLPTGTSLLIQVVGGRRSVTPLPPAEAQPPTDLVVITASAPVG